jgi:nucleotide-binding universal stress UspA family protein
MFKHILVPTDGSPASKAALQSILTLAADNGATITALHVLPDFHVFNYRPQMLEESKEEFMKDTTVHGTAQLAAVSEAAHTRKVPCNTVLLRGDRPHRKIVETAQSSGCDLIAMATHGALGLKGVLLGSETHKVLLHSPVPVLVYRPD